jgi:hypothetical protein
MYSSILIIRVRKRRGLGRRSHTCLGEMGNAYRILAENYEGKRPRYSWKASKE